LLLAGDIFDGDWKDYATGLFFAAELSRLRAADIPVVLVRGNHDAASHITRHLRLPDNVRELSVRGPESFAIPGTEVVAHGQGFATKAVTEDLAAGYPGAFASAFNVGLLHTSAGGREGHENYAPCRLETLIEKGYDYWALGHVHEREVLQRDPYIVFPGNLQGRHMREQGQKGAVLVTVDNKRVCSFEHRPLDVVRWRALEVDASEAASGPDAVDLAREQLESALSACEGRTLAARIVLTGPTRAHTALRSSPEQYTNEIRLAANDVGAGAIFIEKVVFATTSAADLAKVREQDDAIGHLARAIRAMQNDGAALRALGQELADIRHKLPLELREGNGALSFDERHLGDILADVEQMLIPRLLGHAREP
jgi:predicted phosphodiesterase